MLTLVIATTVGSYSIPASASLQFSSGFGGGGRSPTSNCPSSITEGSTEEMSIASSGFSKSCLGGGGGRSSVSSNESSISTFSRFLALKMSHNHWCSSFGWSTTAQTCGSVGSTP